MDYVFNSAAQEIKENVTVSALFVLVESCLNRAVTRTVRCACKLRIHSVRGTHMTTRQVYDKAKPTTTMHRIWCKTGAPAHCSLQAQASASERDAAGQQGSMQPADWGLLQYNISVKL